jgi:hypothetical protein
MATAYDHEADVIGEANPYFADLVAIREDRRRRSSAAKIATQVWEDREAAARDQAQLDDQLQARRQARLKARRRIAGLSTAERVAAQRIGA